MNIWEKLNIQVNDWDSLLAIKFLENTESGGVFCDVGACRGIVTDLFKSISGESGFVYSFEMNINNYNFIKGLESSNCVVENLAVSDSVGKADIYSHGNDPGDHTSNIVGYDTSFSKMNIIGSANTTTLDEYFKGKKKLDYLKIDVEGAELKVIKGGLQTIKKCKYVIIECHFESDWQEIFDFLRSNELDFKNLTDDKPIYYGETIPIPGIGKNGMPYQIYLKQ